MKWIFVLDNEVVVETLIRHGADVNAKAYDGYAPLHSAARQGNFVNQTEEITWSIELNEIKNEFSIL